MIRAHHIRQSFDAVIFASRDIDDHFHQPGRNVCLVSPSQQRKYTVSEHSSR